MADLIFAGWFDVLNPTTGNFYQTNPPYTTPIAYSDFKSVKMANNLSNAFPYNAPSGKDLFELVWNNGWYSDFNT